MKRGLALSLLSLILVVGCDAQKSSAPATEEKPAPKTTQAAEAKQAATQAEAPAAVNGDPQKGKQLAQACSACHGMEGKVAAKGVPYIGGQQAAYLVVAMQEYGDGKRKHEEMRAALAKLSAQDLADVAAYYASQQPRWRGAGLAMPARTAKKPPIDPRAIANGKAKSKACAACHGENGVSQRPEFPSLAGLPEDYFRSALNGYFKGGRSSRYMSLFKNALSDPDISDLAAYYASLTPRRVPFRGTGDATAGEAKAAACAGCHGADGNSPSTSFPSLTGQSAEYLSKAIEDYQSGRRRNAMMRSATAKLGKQEIRNLAAFFASQQPVKIGTRLSRPSGDPLADGARLAAHCDGCHGSGGNSSAIGIPSLAGLGVPYLAKAITDYRDGNRKHAVMQSMVESLSDIDIEKLGFHYALQKPELIRKPARGNAANGAKLAATCDGCHGQGGNSRDPKTPRLAGQDPGYLAMALANYAKGARGEGVMQGMAAGLKKQDMLDLAAHYTSQSPAPIETRAPETVAAIASRCDRCHGENGRGGAQGQPRLAGQSQGYLVKVLQEYQHDQRRHSGMKIMTEMFSLIETHEIARHYANQQP